MIPSIAYAELERLLQLAKGDAEAAHEVGLFLNVELWGDQEDEQFTESDIDEYLEVALDRCAPGIPDSLEVIGYRRVRLSPDEPDPDTVLKGIYERLDEEYNCGDDASVPTEPVKWAARAFCDLIRREYVPWSCDPAVKVTLDAADVRRKLVEFWPEEYGPKEASS